ncbi:alpha-L-fucosidase [Sphingobacterium detergens]|nr:alpha-L-fucosidase [Sphingobacterium detergens]
MALYQLVSAQKNSSVPTYLAHYKELYQKNPQLAAQKWFNDARYGLFVHWGASTYYEKGEWNMFYAPIPIHEYKEQAMKFKGEKFNADSLVHLAKDAQMRYITFVVQHHDGFALYDSKAWPFNSMKAASHRDFLKELVLACQKEGIGLFIYYSLGINWTHPFYLTKAYYNEARPAYKNEQPEIRFKDKSDFLYYWNTVKAQITELCTQYGTIAGFWFDPIGGAYTNPDLFDIQAIYDQIHSLQPQALISFKTGFNGNEDFISCEHEIKSLTSLMRKVQGEKTAMLADKAWQSNRSKKAEMCTTMQNMGWGYESRAKHKTAQEVWAILENTAANNANLLLNIGPYPDGSIVPIDRQVLTEIGKRIKKEGFPKLNTSTYMDYRDGGSKQITDRDLETAK